MFGDLTLDKMVIIIVIAIIVIGPERLPKYAAQLGRFTRTVRGMANGARDRVREEMGDEFDATEWSKLDPRQYDPRRIIRDALIDDEPVVSSAVVTKPVSSRRAPGPRGERYQPSAYEQRMRAEAGGATGTPFDLEST